MNSENIKMTAGILALNRIKKQQLNNYKKNSDYKTSLKLSKNQRLEKQRLINAIKSRVNRLDLKGSVFTASKLIS